MNVFLKAEWKNLVNLTYKIDPKHLLPHLPEGLELDIQDGSAFVSLVLFEFLNTKVKGIKVPFHVDFPEINLRYYVKYKGRKGVVFVKEYVPRHCISFIAQKLYNEPYVSYPMEVETKVENGHIKLHHQIWKDKDVFNFYAEAGSESYLPETDSIEDYFKEHSLGFGVDHSGQTIYYKVGHPVWELHPLLDYKLDFDFGKLYGDKWAFLNTEQPFNRLFAKGSEIKVYSPRKLEDLDPFLDRYEEAKTIKLQQVQVAS